MTLRRADHDLAADAMRALDRIREACGQKVSAQVLTRLRALPTMLRASGVLATLAFYAAKRGEKKDLEKAYDIVGAELRAQICAVLGWQETGRPSLSLDFLTRFTDHLRANPASLGMLSVRLEEFSGWLSRLAEALEREQASDAS
jgi:hypothetical protein